MTRVKALGPTGISGAAGVCTSSEREKMRVAPTGGCPVPIGDELPPKGPPAAGSRGEGAKKGVCG
jgi:hypothetical protein